MEMGEGCGMTKEETRVAETVRQPRNRNGYLDFWKDVASIVWLRMIFLGDIEIIGGDPLWFMLALLYAYLIFWLIYRFDLQKIAHILLPLLLLLRICTETYTNSFGAERYDEKAFTVDRIDTDGKVLQRENCIKGGKIYMKEVLLLFRRRFNFWVEKVYFCSIGRQ